MRITLDLVRIALDMVRITLDMVRIALDLVRIALDLVLPFLPFFHHFTMPIVIRIKSVVKLPQRQSHQLKCYAKYQWCNCVDKLLLVICVTAKQISHRI